MALHELATNAAKYGSLSNGAGRVNVTWTITPKNGSGDLHMTWTEAGGPPVSAPQRKGFGSRLIEHNLAGAHSSEDAQAFRIRLANRGVCGEDDEVRA